MFIILLVSALLAYVVLKAVYQVFLSPLSHVPGPWYAAIGDWWNEWQQLALHWSRTNHRLFEKYGPVVRIGANKVIFQDEAAYKIVYAQNSKLARDPYYLRFMTNGDHHAMTIQDHTTWSYRRRATAPHYTSTNLGFFEPEIQKYTLQMVDGLLADEGKTAFDLMSVFRHLLVDVVFATAFNMDNKTVQKWANGETDDLDLAVTDFPKLCMLKGLLPDIFLKAVYQLPLPRVKQFLKADENLAVAARRVYEHYANDVEFIKEDAASQGRKSMMQRLMDFKLPDSGRNFYEKEVLSETQAHLIAGSETTATTASMMLWELTQHPDILEKVRAEIDDAVPLHSVGSINTLFTLPYFNAFIKEGLRIYAVIPGPMLRVIPASMTDFSIAGFKIPAGTSVAVQAWTQHRQPDIFPEPYAIKPERWLDGKETESMRVAFIPFGAGPRACVGQQLGQSMLRILVSTIVRHFDIVPAKETTPETMRIWESFALFPAGLQAKFNLVPREKH